MLLAVYIGIVILNADCAHFVILISSASHIQGGWRYTRTGTRTRKVFKYSKCSNHPHPYLHITLSVALPCTSQWCHLKKAAAAAVTSTTTISTTTSCSGTGSASSTLTTLPAATIGTTSASVTIAQRKVYSCKTCGTPASSPDHSQLRSQRYCPSLFPNISKEEWLAQRQAEARAKASAKTNQQ